MRLKGKWRIVETELWDADFIDLVGPGLIAFDGKGAGEFRFGAVSAALDCSDTPAGADFTWVGFDEMDEASGEGVGRAARGRHARGRDRVSQWR